MTQGTAIQALARGSRVFRGKTRRRYRAHRGARARRVPRAAADRRARVRARRQPLPHVLLLARPADPQRRPAGDHRAARPRGARPQPRRARALPPRRARRARRRGGLRHRRLVAVLAERARVDARLPPARRQLPRQPLPPHATAAPTARPTAASPATSASRRASASPASPRLRAERGTALRFSLSKLASVRVRVTGARGRDRGARHGRLARHLHRAVDAAAPRALPRADPGARARAARSACAPRPSACG